MSLYNWITLALVVIGWAITYGKLCQKINQIDAMTWQQDEDIKALKKWGEQEIAKAIGDRNANFVRKDVLNECLIEIKRRLDEVNTVELNSRLSRIEAQLDQIQIILNGGKR